MREEKVTAMTNIPARKRKRGYWRDAHDNLSRVLISSMMKKFDRNRKEIAHELGITPEALNWNIQKLGLLEPGAIEKYAMGSEFLNKKPQPENGAHRAA